MSEAKRYTLRVKGKVQGVFFRKSTQEKALELGLTGFVRNDPDGSVFIDAEGPESQLNQILKWSYHGPESSIVISVDIKELEPEGYEVFRIHH